MTTPARKRLMRDFKSTCPDGLQRLLVGLPCRAAPRRPRRRLPPLTLPPPLSVSLTAGLQQDPPEGVNASPTADNIMHWNAIIFGPDGTIWDGGVFKLSLEFSEDYPNKAPVVKFKTKLFHPNGEQRKRGVCVSVSGKLRYADLLLLTPPPTPVPKNAVQSTRTAASAWTFSKISGPPSTTSPPSSPPSSPCCPTRTPTLPPTPRRRGCTSRTGASTTDGSRRWWRPPGWTTGRGSRRAMRRR